MPPPFKKSFLHAHLFVPEEGKCLHVIHHCSVVTIRVLVDQLLNG